MSKTSNAAEPISNVGAAAWTLRRAIDVWPLGWRTARLNAGPIVLFIVMMMLFAGALTRLGPGPVTLGVLWLAGVYAAAIVFVAALRTMASDGAERGMAALAGSGVLHRTALRGALIMIVGAVLGFGALQALVGPPIYTPIENGARVVDWFLAGRALVAAAGPPLAAAVFGVAFIISGLLLGEGAARAALRGLSKAPRRRPSLLPQLGAALLGPGPFVALAVWLELARPNAAEAGDYWAAEHALGEVAMFAAAALALVFAAAALTGRRTEGAATPD